MSEATAMVTIERSLLRLKQRVRRVQRWRAAVQTGSVCLAGLLGLVAVEMLLGPLGSGVRWVMWGGWCVATMWMAWRSTGALRRPIRDVALARWVELRHPEFDERLSTVLEVRGGDGVSEELLREIVSKAEKDVAGLDPDDEVRWLEWVKRWLWPMAGVALVLGVWILWSPREMGRVVWRVVVPFSQIGSVGEGELAVLPGSVELMEGDAIEIVGKAARDGALRVVLEMDGGEEVEQAMSEVGGEWRYRLEPVQRSFHYTVRMGRQTSDRMEVKVWPMPRWSGGELRLVSPAYTGLAVRDLDPEGHRVTAVVGSRLEMEGVLPLGVEGIGGLWVVEGEERRKVEGEMEVSSSGVRVKLAVALDQVGRGEWVVAVEYRLGREIEILRVPVEVVEDRVPEVVRVKPSGEAVKVRPEESLDLVYGVTEDYGVAEVRLEAEAGEKRWELPMDLPEEVVARPLKKYRGVMGMSVGEVRDALEGANAFRVRVVAFDARPESLAGPGRGNSSWLKVDLDAGAESLAWQRLREEHEGAKKALEASSREAREAKERMEWHRGEMKKEEMSEQAVKHFEEAADRLAAAQKRMEELAVAMEESVHAKEAAKAHSLAEQLKQARQELESIPLQDDAAKKESKLDFAKQTAEEAARQMEQMLQRLDRERQKVEDLARLEELATKQKELARQAEQALRGGEKVQPSWKDEQKRVEEALRQRLRDQPQALATSLEMQAADAERLAEQAKDLAGVQQALQKAAEQAGKPEAASAEREKSEAEAVKEALKHEQSLIADGLKEALEEAQEARVEEADRLPEAVGAAAEAAAALSQGKAEDAKVGAEKAAEVLSRMEQERVDDGSAPSGTEGEKGAEAGGEKVAEAGGEKGAEAGGEKGAEAGGEKGAEAGGEKGAEAGGEKGAEAGGEKGAEAGGEKGAEAGGEKGAEAGGEKGAEAGGEKGAEAGGEKGAEAGGEKGAEAGGEKGAEAGGEKGAEAGGEKGAEEVARAEKLAELKERQEKVAGALEALEKGNLAQARQAAAELQADAATRLSLEARAITEVDGHGALEQARGESREAGARAEEAQKQGGEGKSQEAAVNHGRAAEHLERAAASLQQTASDFRQRAKEVQGRQAAQGRAPAGAEELAKAFQEAGAAAETAETSAAEKAGEPRVPVEGRQAAQAKSAAMALAEAAQTARSEMQGRGPSSPSPGGPNPSGMPGEGEGMNEPDEGVRPAQAEPGVPPELAKLGISAEDWEKIRESLKSDVGGRGGVGVPEEYMGLVKEYFQSMSQGGSDE